MNVEAQPILAVWRIPIREAWGVGGTFDADTVGIQVTGED